MPPNLDMHTVFIVCSALNVVLAACMLLVYLTRRPYPGFLHWTVGCICQGLALTMFAYPQFFPELLITVGGNILFVLYATLYNRGLRAFAGRPVSNLLLVLTLVTGGLAAYYFSALNHSMIWRITILTGLVLPYYLDSAWYVWRERAFRYEIVRPWLAGAFMVLASWSVARIVLMATLERPGSQEIWTPSFIQGATMTLITSVNIAITTGVIVLNFQRLSATLQERERRLSLAVSATQDAIWEWNIQSNETYHSPRMWEILGLDSKSYVLTLQSWNALCHPRDLPKINAKVQATISSPEAPPYQAEFRMRHSDGSWRWIQGRGRVVEWDAQGRPVLMSGTSADITEMLVAREQHARLEAQLHQAQKMEALGTLAGGIAHDFNNILVGILGNLQLAEMELAENNPAVPLLKNAHKACRRARDLIARIMTFSRKGEPTRQPVAIGAVITEVAALVRASLPRTITVLERIAPHCPPFQGDPAQIHEVLMNLIVNSSAALGAKGGVIEISLQHGEPGGEVLAQHPHVHAGPQLQLAVRDDGSGMSAEVLARIFEPFFSTKGPGQGSGIGLTMVHRIVTDAGGTIAVDTAPGRGTKITLFLPVGAAAPGPSAPAHPPVARAEGRVLLVDDEPDVLTVANLALRQIGLTPEPHARGAEALAAFKFDCGAYVAVLTDLSMPQMSGLELTAEIRRLNPHVPVVIMTGHLTESAQAGAVALGNVQFLRKPFELQQLQALLAECAGKEPRRS